MLYIFSRNNSLQLLWGSRDQRRAVQDRASQLDTRIGLTAFIRTRSAG